MSADGSSLVPWADIKFADGGYRFRLAIKQLRELEEKCGAGVMEIFHRLLDQKSRADDIRETLRLGLIGGGLEPQQALTLVIRYVDERPLMENIPTAQIVLGSAIFGVPGDQPGKTPAVPTAADRSGSVQEPFTASVLQ